MKFLTIIEDIGIVRKCCLNQESNIFNKYFKVKSILELFNCFQCHFSATPPEGSMLNPTCLYNAHNS